MKMPYSKLYNKKKQKKKKLKNYQKRKVPIGKNILNPDREDLLWIEALRPLCEYPKIPTNRSTTILANIFARYD